MIFLRPLKLLVPALALFLAFSAGAQTLQSIKLNSLGANLDCSTSGIGSMFFVNDTLYFCNTNTGTGNSILLGNAASETISAAMVTAGDFGSLAGGGNYSFSGSLGVGTTTPATPLHVVSSGNNLLTLESTGANSYLLLKTSTGLAEISASGAGYLYFGGSSASPMIFRNSAYTERMRVNTDGKVGIGTTTPAGLLTGFTNNWNSTNYAFQFINLDGGGSDGNTVLIKGGSLSPSSRMLEVQDYSGNTEFYVDGSGKGVFSNPITVGYTSATTDAARKDYVDNNFAPLSGAGGVWKLSGNNLYASSTSYSVGIGTTTPSQKLDILGGNLEITGTTGSAIADTFPAGSSTQQSYIHFPAVSGSNDPGYIMHETLGAGADANEGVLHLSPSDDNGYGDYISIHGTNDADVLKLHTDGTIEGIKAFYGQSNKLGIGTSTPNSQLTVFDSSGSNPTANIKSSATSQTILRIDNTTSRNWELAVGGSANGVGVGKFYIYDTIASGARLVIDTSGNVGIGTTTPAMNLQVSSAAVGSGARNGVSNLDGTNFLYLWPGFSGASNDAAVVWDSVGDLRFGTESVVGTGFSEKMRIETGGNVGIGTASPNSFLDVVKSSGTRLQLQYNEGVDSYSVIRNRNNADSEYRDLVIRTNDFVVEGGTTGAVTERFRIQDGGNVGIGTTTPATELHVVSASGNAATFNQPITIGYPVASTDAARKDYVDNLLTGVSGVWKLSGNNLYASSTAYNVGIGTTTPAAKLHVAGSVYLDNGNSYWIGSLSDSGNRMRIHQSGANGYIDYYSSLQFRTGISSSAPKVVFDTSGNVGIGTTTPAALLHVEGVGGANNPQVLLSNDGWYGGKTTTGTEIRMLGINSSNTVYMGAVENAGGNVVIREDGSDVITLSGSNVGIGASAPGAKLEVGTVATAANVISRVLTADGYNAGFEAYGNSQGTGYLFAGQGSTYGGGIFYNGDGTPAFATGEAADQVSFFRKNVGVNEVVFSYPYSGNVVTFRDRITIGYPSVSTDAARKDYVDALVGGGQYWIQSGNNLYSSSTSWLVGVGATPTSSLKTTNTTSITLSSGEGKVQIMNYSAATSSDSLILRRTSSPNTHSTGILFSDVNSLQAAIRAKRTSMASNYSSDLLFYTGDNTSDFQDESDVRMTITSAGKVGIGTTNPQEQLEIFKDSTAGEGVAGLSIISATGQTKLIMGTSNSQSYSWIQSLQNGISWTNRPLSLQPNGGNVGIGTTAPNTYYNTTVSYQVGGINSDDKWLTVSGSSATTPAVFNLENSIDTDGGTIGGILWTRFGGQADAHRNVAGIIGIQKGTGVTAGSELQFWTKGGGGPTPVMVINNSGSVGIGTTTPSNELHVVGSGNVATFSGAITIGYPSVSTDAARKDYVDAAIGSGAPTAYATSSGACDLDATCEMNNADLGGTGNITGVSKLTVTTIDPLYQIKGKKYSTYASAIVGGVKEEYVGRAKLVRKSETLNPKSETNSKFEIQNSKLGGAEYQYILDFDKVSDGSDLWVWHHAVDFSEDNVEVLVTPIGVPVPVAYEVKGNKIIFSAESTNHKLPTINFSYRLVGKRIDWVSWPTFAKDQTEKAGIIVK